MDWQYCYISSVRVLGHHNGHSHPRTTHHTFAICLLIFLGVLIIQCESQSRNQSIAVGLFEEDYELALNMNSEWKSTTSKQLSLKRLNNLLGKTGYDQLIEAFENLQSSNVAIVVGPYEEFYHMAAVKLNVPYMITSMLEKDVAGTAFYMMPKPTLVCSAVEELLRVLGWTIAGIIYDETLDAAILNQLVGKLHMTLKFAQIPSPATPEAVRSILLRFRAHGVTEFIVLARANMINTILVQARRLGIVATPQSWMLLNLGSLNVSMGVLDDLHINMTIINLVEETAVEATLPVGDTLNIALLTDALMSISQTTQNGTGPISERLKQVDLNGHTGQIMFNNEGWRTNLSISIYHRVIYNFSLDWKYYLDTRTLVSVLPNVTHRTQAFMHTVTPLKGRTVRVITILEKPFCMLKANHTSETGNARFYGYSVDMMEEIGKMLDFKYNLYLVRDGNFGALQPNGGWNGIIGEILNGSAEMSFAPLNLNADREKAIDFSTPYTTRGITVLIKTPESQSSYFQFMKPLSTEVWVCTMLTMCIVTVALYTYERYGISTVKDSPQITMRESLWFIFGSLVAGGTDTAPVTLPGRIITSAWWFFSLILISTYTANLAAFLTVKQINSPISSVAELAYQSKIKYGTVKNSGVETFFKNSNVEPYLTMWKRMSSVFPGAMVNNTEAGITKVAEGNYAFLWDNTVTSYVTAHNCGYTTIGIPFDQKGYSMGVPPGAVYLEQLSMAILRLGDDGKIGEIAAKYWTKQDCSQSQGSSDETSALLLESAAGMFFVLVGGLVLGGIALGIERLLRKLKIIKEKSDEENEESGNDKLNGASNQTTTDVYGPGTKMAENRWSTSM